MILHLQQTAWEIKITFKKTYPVVKGLKQNLSWCWLYKVQYNILLHWLIEAEGRIYSSVN